MVGKTDVAASILFDARFLEPAFLTAFDMTRWVPGLPRLYLIYLLNGDTEDQEATALITDFCTKVDSPFPIVPIAINNTLPQFSAYHFSTAIIYKALLPSILPGEKRVMNVDAGALLGPAFPGFWQEVSDNFPVGGDWVIAGHCQEPEFPEALANEPHNPLYPAGGILLFNCERAVQADWHHRLMANYRRFLPHLRYGEQEIICLTAGETELLDLPQGPKREIAFLNTDALLGTAPTSIAMTDDCLFFKFCGSFKPWKYWVLDPRKSIYTALRAEFETLFALSGHPLIERHRQSVDKEEWLYGFLRAYDIFLQRGGLSAHQTIS